MVISILLCLRAKSSFISGVWKLCHDCEKCVRQVLQELTKMAEIATYRDILKKHIFKQVVDQQSAMSEFPCALLGGPVAFEDGTSHIMH